MRCPDGWTLLGAFCVAVSLGSLVLTFASADPERDVVGPWGLALVPLGLGGRGGIPLEAPHRA